MYTFTHQFFYGTVLSQCSKNHFPHCFFSSDSPLFQSLHYSKFGTCYLVFVCHLLPRTFFKFSKIIFSFILFRLLFNFSISKAFYSILTSILFSFAFLIVGLQRKPGTGYHEMGNIDNVIDLLGAQACKLTHTHTHTHTHTQECR